MSIMRKRSFLCKVIILVLVVWISCAFIIQYKNKLKQRNGISNVNDLNVIKRASKPENARLELVEKDVHIIPPNSKDFRHKESDINVIQKGQDTLAQEQNVQLFVKDKANNEDLAVVKMEKHSEQRADRLQLEKIKPQQDLGDAEQQKLSTKP